MKKWMKAAGVFSVALSLLVGCSSSPATNEGGSQPAAGESKPAETAGAVKLNLGHVWTASEIHSQAVEQFAAEVDKLSNGSVKIEVFGDGTLGKDKDLLEGLKVGTADIWIGGAGVLSGSSDAAKIFTVPFMFENQEHFNKVYDGEVGKEVSAAIEQQSGYKVLTYWDRGARWLTVNKEVKKPEDLSGLKIRVPESPVFVKSFQQLGAAPTPMAFGEVYTAIQQGVIDGQENPLSLIYSSKFSEVNKFLVKTEHVREPIAMVISSNKFNSLSPEQQNTLMEAANGQAKKYVIEQVDKGNSEFLTKLQEEGMTLVEPDLAAFQAKLEGFVDTQFPEVKELYEKIQSAK